MRVLGIDYEDAQTVAAMELAAKTGVTYPLLADPQSALAPATAFPLPTGLPIFAVRRQGRQVASGAYGEIESSDELVDLVDEHLGVDPVSAGRRRGRAPRVAASGPGGGATSITVHELTRFMPPEGSDARRGRGADAVRRGRERR